MTAAEARAIAVLEEMTAAGATAVTAADFARRYWPTPGFRTVQAATRSGTSVLVDLVTKGLVLERTVAGRRVFQLVSSSAQLRIELEGAG